MMKARFSTSFNAKRKRIKRLPKIVDDLAMTSRKRDAFLLVKKFDEGIEKDELSLKRLKSATIKQKKRKGYSMPSTPLYGKGQEKTSYHKMLRIRKLKNGYKVFVSRAMHNSKKVSLEVLFDVHENGAIINNGKALIRIPPRPAFLRAFQFVLKDIARRENTQLVKKTIARFVRDGNIQHVKKVQNKLVEGLIKAGALV